MSPAVRFDIDTNAGVPPQTRTIAVVLSEDEWREFVAVQPRPVDWLKEQIRQHVSGARPQTWGPALAGPSGQS